MEVLELDDEERDRLLIRMDTRQEIMTEAIMDLKKGMYGEDGQGGVCARVSKLENFQSTILAFVAAIAMAVTLAGNWAIGKITGGGN